MIKRYYLHKTDDAFTVVDTFTNQLIDSAFRITEIENLIEALNDGYHKKIWLELFQASLPIVINKMGANPATVHIASDIADRAEYEIIRKFEGDV